eukprot:Tamp_08827.p1 GENE.Tamp_08827~~Tamp_08827.p1  ORF type:complete len:712 (+),score=113.37 Tamp_08827:28-2136(+)
MADAAPALDDDGPPEDDAIATRAKGGSKLARFLDREDQTALYRSEYRWNSEEDAALIKRRSIPLVALSRSQSAHRSDLISRLGGGTQAEKEEVRDYQLQRDRPEFSLDAGDRSSVQNPAQSAVREYLRVSQARAKELKFVPAMRHFPAPNARQSVIQFYLKTHQRAARMNPYADVELVFSSRRHALAALLKHRAARARADPYRANPHIEQDNAAYVAKRARQIRINLAHLGIVNAATQKGGESTFQHIMHGGEAWKRIKPQPTKVTVEEVKNWKVLGEKDPRLQVSPSARRGHTMTKIDSSVALLFGGALGKGFQYSSQLFSLHFHSQKFELLEVCGTQPSGRSFHSAVLVDHTRLLVFGGLGKQGSLADCYEFKVSESQWSIVFTKGPVKPAPRYGHSMVETFRPGVVLLYGGAGAGFFGDLFSLDTRTGQWTELVPGGSIPDQRAFHSAISLMSGTKMVIFGGQNGSANLGDLHEYDIEMNTWTFVRTHGVQPSPRWCHTVVRKGSDSFIVFGGAGESFFEEILLYNSFQALWRQAYGRGPSPGPRWGHSCVHQEEMGALFIFGGCNKDAPTQRDLYQFGMDGLVYGVPPARKRAGDEGDEKNSIMSMVLQERSGAWDRTNKSTSTGHMERRWSSKGKRHTQGNVVVLTQVAPFQSRQEKLYKTVGAPTLGETYRRQERLRLSDGGRGRLPDIARKTAKF